MLSPPTRRSPRQTRKSIGAAGSMPGTPTRRENAPLQPSPLRNELASASKSRKRARSLGGAGIDDPTAPPSAKQTNPRKKRMTIVYPLTLAHVKKVLMIGSVKGDFEESYGCWRDSWRGCLWRTYCYWDLSGGFEGGEG
jgi:hypothetical protein